jgi:hypothetical protein
LRRAYENDDKTYDAKTHKERIIRFASGFKVTINELADIKSTIVDRGKPARLQRDPTSKCINSFAGTAMVDSPQEVISGEEAIAGYWTVKITSNGYTAWFALDHGCAMVKSKMDWGKQGSSEKNLVALIPGEPEAALFDVPANVREAPPSERMLRPSLTLKPQDIEHLRKLDDIYYKNRAEK